MRIGVNGMCGYVRSVSLDPTKGDAYVFAAPARKLMNPNIMAHSAI